MADSSRNANIVISVRNQASPEIRALTGDVGTLITQLRQAAIAAGQDEAAFLSLAGALSREALAAGDAARAEQILAEANRGLAVSAEEASVATKGVGTNASGAEQGVNLLATATKAAGVAFVAYSIASKAVDLGVQGAAAQLTAQRFDKVAEATGKTREQYLSLLRAASHGEIADSALELDVMKARLLGVGSSAEKLAPLLALSRDRAQQMGITTEQAFERLVTGLGRGSARILDDLGIIVKVGDVNTRYAASLGKTADQLTETEKRQALVNEALRQGAATAAETGGAVDGTANALARSATDWQNFKDAAGGGLANVAAASFAYRDAITGAGTAAHDFLFGQQASNAAMQQGTASIGGQIDSTLRSADANDRASLSHTTLANAIQVDLAKKIEGKQAADRLAQAQAQLDVDSARAAQGMLGSGDQAVILAQKYGIAEDAARGLIRAQQDITNATALADQRVGERDPSNNLTADQFDKFSKLQADRRKEDAAQAERDAKALAASRARLEESQATTTAQKIALQRKRLAAATGEADRNNEQARLNDLLTQQQHELEATGKRHTSELNKQLSLEERIRDSKEKQLAATLDASAAIIRDRQQRRDEDKALRLADRRLNNPRLNEQQRAAVQDARDLILIEQQQRQLQIREQLATAGGQVINGRILQSRQTGALPPLPQATAAGALPPLPPIASPGAGGAGAGGGVPTVQVFIGNEQIKNFVVRTLRDGLSGASSAGAGS